MFFIALPRERNKSEKKMTHRIKSPELLRRFQVATRAPIEWMLWSTLKYCKQEQWNGFTQQCRRFLRMLEILTLIAVCVILLSTKSKGVPLGETFLEVATCCHCETTVINCSIWDLGSSGHLAETSFCQPQPGISRCCLALGFVTLGAVPVHHSVPIANLREWNPLCSWNNFDEFSTIQWQISTNRTNILLPQVSRVKAVLLGIKPAASVSWLKVSRLTLTRVSFVESYAVLPMASSVASIATWTHFPVLPCSSTVRSPKSPQVAGSNGTTCSSLGLGHIHKNMPLDQMHRCLRRKQGLQFLPWTHSKLLVCLKTLLIWNPFRSILLYCNHIYNHMNKIEWVTYEFWLHRFAQRSVSVAFILGALSIVARIQDSYSCQVLRITEQDSDYT